MSQNNEQQQERCQACENKNNQPTPWDKPLYAQTRGCENTSQNNAQQQESIIMEHTIINWILIPIVHQQKKNQGSLSSAKVCQSCKEEFGHSQSNASTEYSGLQSQVYWISRATFSKSNFSKTVGTGMVYLSFESQIVEKLLPWRMQQEGAQTLSRGLARSSLLPVDTWRSAFLSRAQWALYKMGKIQRRWNTSFGKWMCTRILFKSHSWEPTWGADGALKIVRRYCSLKQDRVITR